MHFSLNAMIHGYLYYMDNIQNGTAMTYIGYTVYYKIMGVSRHRLVQDTTNQALEFLPYLINFTLTMIISMT